MKLEKSQIIRDSWTKLNVAPSKIFQQENVIAELSEHLATAPEEPDSLADLIRYLQAANCFFENGFLSHEKVFTLDSEPVRHIELGLLFLRNWFHDLSESQDFRPASTKERRFISWQTFDLIRLSIYGFMGLVQDFSLRFPGYYLVPHRINGSSVETVFSQVKQRVSGAVSSLNYESGARRLQVSASLGDTRKRKDEIAYRNASLAIKSAKLQK